MQEFVTLTKSNVQTFKHSIANANVETSNLARRLKNKYIRHEFLDRGRIANNLTQRVLTEFLYKT